MTHSGAHRVFRGACDRLARSLPGLGCGRYSAYWLRLRVRSRILVRLPHTHQMHIRHSSFVFVVVVAVLTSLLGCANRAPRQTSPPRPPELSAAEAFIDAFYSFDSDKLKTAMASAASSIPRVVFYQGWAQGGNYKVLQRMPCKFESAAEITCAITVKDDLIGALGIDFNVTDTFHLFLADGKIIKVRNTSNDPKAFNDAAEWVVSKTARN